MLASKLALSGNRGRIIGWSHFFCACRTAPGRAPVASPPATLLRPWPSWAYFGATLGYLGAILGLSWACLGLLYLYITPRRSQSTFFAPAFCRCETLVFGILLPWLFPELLLENSWGHLGQSWAILQPPWSHLGLYWAHLGPISGLPGAILAEFMQTLH